MCTLAEGNVSLGFANYSAYMRFSYSQPFCKVSIASVRIIDNSYRATFYS